MAHELSIRADGFVEHAFAAEEGAGWHGLGQPMPEDASIEDWVKGSGMDWQIKRSRVRYSIGDDAGPLPLWNDKHVLFRSDSHKPLGLVSDEYKVVQPREVIEFFRDLVESAGFKLSTAGCLFGGQRFWALAKLDEVTIAGWDKVGGYLLLSTSCDGSMATEARETTVRVVCNNTLSMARMGGSARVKVTHRSKFDAAAVKDRLGLGLEHFHQFAVVADALSRINLDAAAARRFTNTLFGTAESVRAHAGEEKVLSLFSGAGKGAGQPGSFGTAWGLLNAVTEYTDWHKTAKTADHRTDSAWYGDGNALKERALATIVEQML